MPKIHVLNSIYVKKKKKVQDGFVLTAVHRKKYRRIYMKEQLKKIIFTL